jgi:hypothetical protein
MMKTKINYTTQVNAGLSIYDHFKDPALLNKMIAYARRHFKRDSFYVYASPVRTFHPDKTDLHEYKKTYLIAEHENIALRWIEIFERYYSGGEYDYFLEPKTEEDVYSGYNDRLREITWLSISKEELETSGDLIRPRCKTIFEYFPEATQYRIRLFKKGQRIFPAGFKAFRVSVCQQAVNFPPLTAKLIYERYTKPNTKAIVWDPSSGWGGRILGAMAVSQDRGIHYIGTDPNPDHTTTSGRTKYHELADFYNTQTYRSGPFCAPINTYEIYQCGSEEMHLQDNFQKYKGNLDLVFTSPAYFCKELYSDDPTQSAIKFDTYDSWRDNFLKRTLKTAFDWLKPGGYIAWNIADVKFGKDIFPLEQDSIDYLKSLGMQHIETLKMVLARMPGGNRLDPETGEPMMKNFCKVKLSGSGEEGYFKYEPIFIFRKP